LGGSAHWHRVDLYRGARARTQGRPTCIYIDGARWEGRGAVELVSLVDNLEIIVGRRWPLIVALFIIEIVFVVWISNSPFFPREQESYVAQYNSLGPVLNASAPGQVYAIFKNNYFVSVAELVPIAGPVIFGVSLYQTARIVEVIGIVKNVGSGFALADLFILPHTWLELPAYSIAAAESFYLTAAMLGLRGGRRGFVNELGKLVVNLILIAGVLIVAATFEVTEIQIQAMNASKPATDPAQLLPLITWIPFAAIAAGAVAFWKRARRDLKGLEERDAAAPAPPSGSA